MKIKKFLPLLILLGLGLLIWASPLHRYFNFQVVRENYAQLLAFVTSSPLISRVIFISIYCGAVALSIPGASFLSLLAGLLFSQWEGTLWVVLAATGGACLLFMSVRLAATNFINANTTLWVQKMEAGFQENAFFYLLTLRLVPLFPFFAVNLAAGLLQVPFRTFFWATFLGIIPGSFVFVALGEGLREILSHSDLTPVTMLSPGLVLGLTGLGILSLFPVFYEKFLKKKKKSAGDQKLSTPHKDDQPL